MQFLPSIFSNFKHNSTEEEEKQRVAMGSGSSSWELYPVRDSKTTSDPETKATISLILTEEMLSFTSSASTLLTERSFIQLNSTVTLHFMEGGEKKGVIV